MQQEFRAAFTNASTTAISGHRVTLSAETARNADTEWLLSSQK